jgi:hypothetical protein
MLFWTLILPMLLALLSPSPGTTPRQRLEAKGFRTISGYGAVADRQRSKVVDASTQWRSHEEQHTTWVVFPSIVLLTTVNVP